MTTARYACREWTHQKQAFKLRRQAFARSIRRQLGTPIQYPPELAESFPNFSTWLNAHVRDLKDAQFPVSAELESLHCPPSRHACSFSAMWAYGAHFECNSETGTSRVAFDSGIAAIPPSATCTEIDVGILKNIILVTYGGVNCVVMEGSRIKSRDQGRRVVRKDSYGFWLLQYNCREICEKSNPYVFPASVSQVFFVTIAEDPAWRVVLRHDPRSRRIQGEHEVHVFGASGSTRPILSTRSVPRASSSSMGNRVLGLDAEEVPVEHFNARVQEEEPADDEAHLEDTQFVDEVDLQYVE